MPKTHWAAQYVGLPWGPFGLGPDIFSCWGLVCWCQEKHYGRTVPGFAGLDTQDPAQVSQHISSQEASGDWVRSCASFDGAVLLLSDHHVGLYVDADGGRVFHSAMGHGVVSQSMMSARAMGMGVKNFYLHQSWLS